LFWTATFFLFCHLRYLSYTLSSSRLARVMFPSLGSCHWSFWPLFFRLLFRGSVWWPPLEEEHIACELMCAGGPCGGVVERLGKLLNEEELPCWDIRSGWWSEDEMNSRTGWVGRWSEGEGRSANSGGGRWGWGGWGTGWPPLNVEGPFGQGLCSADAWKYKQGKF
jgi:hypothetical protein